jgi:flagellin
MPSGLVVNTNIAALNAQRSLGKTQDNLQLAIQRLSTGFRINSAADDAAGLAITDRMTAQIRGLNQAIRNANDGVSTLQTADSAFNEYTDLLQRIRELAVQSANDTNSSGDRQSLQAEVGSIIAELDRLANTVSFNNKKLLDGTFASAQFQVGANANQIISFSIGNAQAAYIGAKITQGLAVSSTALGALSSAGFTLNGVTITGLSAATTIEQVITAINNRATDTGVTAIKNSQTIVTDTAFVGLASSSTGTTTSTSLTLNGVTITLTTGNAGTASDFAATVNQYSNQTGVVVSTGTANGIVTFTRASGGDIAIQETLATSYTFGVGDSVAGTSARTFNAGLTLSVDLNGTLSIATAGAGGDLGFTTSVIGTAGTGYAEKRISTLSIATASGANDAIQTVDYALSKVGKLRGDIGALQNRFSAAISSLQVASENISAARSRIKDTDVAQMTAELTRNQILLQAGVSVLSQANQLPQIALSLLSGR